MGLSRAAVLIVGLAVSSCSVYQGEANVRMLPSERGETACYDRSLGDNVAFEVDPAVPFGVWGWVGEREEWSLVGPGTLEVTSYITARYTATEIGRVVVTYRARASYYVDYLLPFAAAESVGACSFDVLEEAPEPPTGATIHYREDSVIVEADGFLFAQVGSTVNGSWTLTFTCADGRCDATIRVSGTPTLLQANSQGVEAEARYDVAAEAFAISFELVSETPNGTVTETHRVDLRVIEWDSDGPAVVDVRWEVVDHRDSDDLTGSVTWEGTATRS